MPNPKYRKAKEQWDECARCGRLFPMSQLTMQKGLLICNQDRVCFDNLDIERHPLVVMSILGNHPEQEGTDRRWVDRSFFDPYEEQI